MHWFPSKKPFPCSENGCGSCKCSSALTVKNILPVSVSQPSQCGDGATLHTQSCTQTCAHSHQSHQYGPTGPSLKPGRRWDNEDWKLRALRKLEVREVKSIKKAMRSVTSSHFTIHVPKGASQRHGRKWDEK